MKRAVSYGLTLCIGFSLALLCGNAGAISERIAYNVSNFSVFGGVPLIQSGGSYEAENGEDVPASILYTDEAGGISNFLSVSRIAELLDADVKWDSRTNTVDFGTATTPGPSTVNPPFSELVWRDGVSRAEDAFEHLKAASFRSESAFDQTFLCRPELGAYVLVQVTNQGERPVSFKVSRDKTIGQPQDFPTDVIRPGGTSCRIFSVDGSGNELTSDLRVTIRPIQGIDFAPLDIIVDVSQQDGIGDSLEGRSMTPPTVTDHDGLSMKVTGQETGGVTVCIDNRSHRDVTSGGEDDYILENYQNGVWTEVTQLEEGFAILPMAHNIRSGSSETMTIRYQGRYGALPEGTYRVKKSFMEIGTQQTLCYLTAEFEI